LILHSIFCILHFFMLLCIGTTPTVQRTLTFARLVPDEVNRAASVDEYASGKSVNVARVAAAIGAQARVTGFIGGDRGRFLAAELSKGGIAHDFQPVPAQTRLCTTVIDRAQGTVTELVEEHAPVTPEDFDRLLERCVRHLQKKKTIAVLSGSLPPRSNPGFYRRVIEVAHARQVRVVLDSRGGPLHEALRIGGFIAKLNLAELAETVDRPLRTEAAIKRAMREVSPRGGAICITMGKEGAAAWDGETFWRIASPRVRAVNPIGSGDAFAAGMAVALERGGPLIAGCILGSACGAANVMTERAGVVDPAQVERLRKKVKVTRW
jgi:tagatose 6-phosphate kinase